MSFLSRHWRLLIAGIAALAAGAMLSVVRFDGGAPPDVQGFFWPDQKALVDFEMVSHRDEPFTLADFEDRWTVLFFGYTYCPDICPVTMSVLREAMTDYRDSAPPELSNLSVAFISVDGERDNPDHLANYIRFYDENWLAASGNRAQVDSLTVQLGVPYEIEPHEPGAINYLVSHPGSLYLVSPDATLAALFHPPFDPAMLASELLEIRRFMTES